MVRRGALWCAAVRRRPELRLKGLRQAGESWCFVGTSHLLGFGRIDRARSGESKRCSHL
jgi:hypothetical protein